MRKYAILEDNTVISVQDLGENEVQNVISSSQLIVDVEDLIITPEIGWILQGNSIVPGQGQQITMQQYVASRILYYQSVAPKILVDLYVENTLLGITSEQSYNMFNEYTDVLLAIREGAFPTAIYALQQKQPQGFVTQTMINNWISIIERHML